MENKELEQLEKVNNENKMEAVKLEERISNLKKEKDEIIKTIEGLGIDVDEAEIVLQDSEEELEKLLKEAKTKLGIE